MKTMLVAVERFESDQVQTDGSAERMGQETTRHHQEMDMAGVRGSVGHANAGQDKSSECKSWMNERTLPHWQN